MTPPSLPERRWDDVVLARDEDGAPEVAWCPGDDVEVRGEYERGGFSLATYVPLSTLEKEQLAASDLRIELDLMAEQERYSVQIHEPNDGWAWEVWDNDEECVVGLCTFNVGAKGLARELNEKGGADAS